MRRHIHLTNLGLHFSCAGRACPCKMDVDVNSVSRPDKRSNVPEHKSSSVPGALGLVTLYSWHNKAQNLRRWNVNSAKVFWVNSCNIYQHPIVSYHILISEFSPAGTWSLMIWRTRLDTLRTGPGLNTESHSKWSNEAVWLFALPASVYPFRKPG